MGKVTTLLELYTEITKNKNEFYTMSESVRDSIKGRLLLFILQKQEQQIKELYKVLSKYGKNI